MTKYILMKNLFHFLVNSIKKALMRYNRNTAKTIAINSSRKRKKKKLKRYMTEKSELVKYIGFIIDRKQNTTHAYSMENNIRLQLKLTLCKCTPITQTH